MKNSMTLLIAMSAISVAILGILNIATFAFYVLWVNADQWAVNRSESSGGFDASQLPPHSGVTWIAAQGTLMSLVTVDVIAIAGIVLFFRALRSHPVFSDSSSGQNQAALKVG